MPDVIQIAIQATDAASKVIGGVGDSLDKLGKQAEDSEKKVKLFGLSTEQIGAKMSQAGKLATIGLTVPIAGLAVAATKAASDLNETSNKIQTLFGNATDSVMEFSKTAATSLGQSQKQALDAAADFAVFGKAAGLAGQDLVKFSQQNVTLAADMASFFNTSPEEAITAIGAAFRGESEPIRRYGVLINEASLKDQALRMGLIKTTAEALQPQARVLAAQALIMQQTSAAQGDFAKTSDGLANQTRILNAQFQDTIASLGQSLLPVAVKATGVVNDLLKSFNSLPQSQKDIIVGFGLMAAAAGPVLTIGGKLVGTFSSLAGVAVNMGGGLLTFGKTIGETAGYLKEVGASSESLKFAFQNLKSTGAVLTAELGVIGLGLAAIAKFAIEAGKAAEATTEELIKMANSGDLFTQAGASFEIVVNGQTRLNAAVQGVNDKVKDAAKSYDEYASAVLGAAVAAGTITKAQADEFLATGRITDEYYHQLDVTDKVISQTGIMTRENYDFQKALKANTGESKSFVSSLLNIDGAFQKILPAIKQSGVYSATATAQTKDYTEGMKALADSLRGGGDAEKAWQSEVEKTISVVKAQNGAIADAYNLAITYTESQRKQADVQAELDKLNETIAARGPARTAVIRDQKLSTEDLARVQLELKVAEEDLAGAQQKSGETEAEFALRVDTLKGKVADYNATLTGHIGTVGGATQAEKEHKQALEEQLAALQKQDEVAKAKGAWDALTQSFRAGILTESQFTERATALNSITNLYTPAALAAAISQEELMKALADPTGEAYKNLLIKQHDALDGVVEKTDAATTATNNLNKAQAEAKPAAPARGEAKTEKAEVPIPAAGTTAAAQAALDYNKAAEAQAASAKKSIEDVSIAQETASRQMKGVTDNIIGGYGSVNNALADTKQRTADMNAAAIQGSRDRSTADELASREMKGHATDVAGAYANIPKVITPVIKPKVEVDPKLAHDIAGDLKYAQPVIKPKVDTVQASVDIEDFRAKKLDTLPKDKTTVVKADTVTATKNINDVMKLFGAIPREKLTLVNTDAKLALQTLDDVLRAINSLYDRTITITTKYVTEGEPPPGAPSSPPQRGMQFGGSMIVPPNPYGRSGDYFPVLAAPGERVTVETPAQQHGSGSVRGDTYTYNTNIYNPLAAAMWADQQRRERLSRSNTRMGVS